MNALEPGDREALDRVLRARRDVRTGFVDTPVDDAVLRRVLAAAHTAPSVGFSQPWDFLVLRDPDLRAEIAGLAETRRAAFAASLPRARAAAFAGLRVEAIREAPVGVVVTCDPTRGGRHVLGRATQPRMAAHSVAGAVQNLWLAARAEGLGVGWVSFFDERELAALLTDRAGMPPHVEIVAYLCLGHVGHFADEPELATAGWARRRPLEWAVHDGTWGHHTDADGAPGGDALDDALAAVADLDPAEGAAAARERLTRMTVPPGALGRVGELGVRLAGLAGACPPPVPEPAVVAVFAGDHGVHARGVTPWPQEVTAQMVANFLAGGAAVNAFAAQVGAEVAVVDVGVAAELDPAPGLIPRKVRRGTADMTAGPAMSRDEARAAVVAGVEIARDLVAAGNRLLVTGDMGIANTTASAALVAAFTGLPPERVTGRGTGIDDATHARKTGVVAEALALHGLAAGDRERPTAAQDDPLGALAAVGGLEHAGLVGLLLGGAALRTPVLLDGVVSGAAALVADALAPTASHAWIAGHRSVEPAHTLALGHLGLEPVLDLGLRVGEGTGALLAAPLVAAAARALSEVATFDAAGVTEK